jgi:hypothetical protein
MELWISYKPLFHTCWNVEITNGSRISCWSKLFVFFRRHSETTAASLYVVNSLKWLLWRVGTAVCTCSVCPLLQQSSNSHFLFPITWAWKYFTDLSFSSSLLMTGLIIRRWTWKFYRKNNTQYVDRRMHVEFLFLYSIWFQIIFIEILTRPKNYGQCNASVHILSP